MNLEMTGPDIDKNNVIKIAVSYSLFTNSTLLSLSMLN